MTSRILKFISQLLVLVMSIESATIPLSQAAVLAPPHPWAAASLRSLSINQPLSFPAHIAEIAKQHQLASPKATVFLVQDIHNHVPAQINIYHVITTLAHRALKNGKKLLVAVEGASGKINSDVLAAHPDQKAKTDVGAALLNAGLLFGEEYAAIMQKPGNISLYGIESLALYKTNYLAKELTAVSRKNTLSIINEIVRQLETLAPHNFNLLLTNLLKKHNAAEEGLLPTTDYVGFLYSIDASVISKYPDLKALVKIGRNEKLFNPEQITKETEKLLADVFQNKPDNVVKNLAGQAEYFKQNKSSGHYFYQELLAQSNLKSDLLSSYASFLSEIETINIDAAFNQIDLAETEIASKLVKHPTSLNLFRYYRWAKRQQRFFSLNMIPQEWERQKNQTFGSFIRTHSQIKTFVAEQVSDLGYSFSLPSFDPRELRLAFKGASTFYQAAGARDFAMAEHLGTLLSQYSSKDYDVVFIAGGFHTDKLIDLFEKQQLSTVVIRPQFELAEPLKTPYHYNSSLRPQLEKLFKKSLISHTLRQPGGIPLAGAEAIKNVISNPSQHIPTDPNNPPTKFSFGLLAALAAGQPLEEFIGNSFLNTSLVLMLSVGLVVSALYFKSSLANISPLDQNKINIRLGNSVKAAYPYDVIEHDQSSISNDPNYVSGKNIRDAISNKTFSTKHFQETEDLAAALDKKPMYSSQIWFPKVAGPNIMLPASLMRQGNTAILAHRTLSKIILLALVFFNNSALKRFQTWNNDRASAKAQNITIEEYQANKLNQEYLRRLNDQINNPEFQKSVIDEKEGLNAMFVDGVNKAFTKYFNKPAPDKLEPLLPETVEVERTSIDQSNPNYLSSLFNFLFHQAKITTDKEKRVIISEQLRILIEFLSAAPKELNSDEVRRYDPPDQNTLISRAEVDDVKDQLDQDIYLGRYAPRMFIGGNARRLNVDKPAALLTPADSKLDNLPPFKDIPTLGRYILQIKSEITDVAERHGWDVATGLALQKIILPTNNNLARQITDHLKSLNYYGFPPHVFIFLEQRSGPGFSYENGFVDSWEGQEQAEKGPFGHGDLELTHLQSNMAYSFDSNGQKHVYKAPLHRLLAAHGKIILHNQLSLNDVMTPGWFFNHTRLALANKVISRGQVGTAEFRRDNTGSKGGYLATSEHYPVSLRQYFGKSSGPVMIEQNQLARPEGHEIRAKLQAQTANAGVVIISARELEATLVGANYHFTATVRGNPDQNASVHPDMVSYDIYFNRAEQKSPQFYVPQKENGEYNWRWELKEPKHFRDYVEAARIQDTAPENVTYQRLARPIQDLIASQNKPQPSDHQAVMGTPPFIRNGLMLGLLDVSLGGQDLSALPWGNIIVSLVVLGFLVASFFDNKLQNQKNSEKSSDTETSFKARQAEAVARAPQKQVEELRQKIDSTFRSITPNETKSSKTIIASIEPYLNNGTKPEGIISAVAVIQTLTRRLIEQGVIDDKKINAHIVFTYSGDKNAELEKQVTANPHQSTALKISIVHIKNGASAEQAIQQAVINNSSSENTYILSPEENHPSSPNNREPFTWVQVGNNIGELALTAFAYAHYNEPASIIERLIHAFQFNGQLLSVTLMADRLASISA